MGFSFLDLPVFALVKLNSNFDVDMHCVWSVFPAGNHSASR